MSEQSPTDKTFRPEQVQEQIAPRDLSLWHAPKIERPGFLAQSSDAGHWATHSETSVATHIMLLRLDWTFGSPLGQNEKGW